MAITVQQFDFIASTSGIQAALAAAEQSGGVTGTRGGATQTASDTSGGRSLTGINTGGRPGTTPGTTPGSTSLPAAPLPGDASGGGGKPSASPLGGLDTAEGIEAEFKKGLGVGLFNNEAEVINALNRIGINNPTALVAHWAGGGTGADPATFAAFGNLNEREREEAEAKRKGTDSESPFIPTVSQGASTRADLFSEQTGAELRRRLIADAFGTRLSPLASSAAQSALSRFGAIDPLLEFNSPEQTLGTRFSTFAGGVRPGGGELDDLLSQLLLTASDPDSGFRDFVPDFRTAAELGTLPGLADVNPRLRRRASSRILGDFDTRMAQRPEQFQDLSASNLAGQIEDFRSRFSRFGGQ